MITSGGRFAYLHSYMEWCRIQFQPSHHGTTSSAARSCFCPLRCATVDVATWAARKAGASRSLPRCLPSVFSSHSGSRAAGQQFELHPQPTMPLAKASIIAAAAALLLLAAGAAADTCYRADQQVVRLMLRQPS